MCICALLPQGKMVLDDTRVLAIATSEGNNTLTKGSLAFSCSFGFWIHRQEVTNNDMNKINTK